MVKNVSANAGDSRDADLIPGSGRSPRVRDGNPLQYSCWENSMGRRVWRAMVHGVSESNTTEHASMHPSIGKESRRILTVVSSQQEHFSLAPTLIAMTYFYRNYVPFSRTYN